MQSNIQGITNIRQDNTVILANGEIPSHPTPLAILKNAEKIICCDGAISFLEQQNIIPHIIIGDCDSITSAQKEKYKSIILMDKNDAYSDLQKAIKYCMKNNLNEVIILGASGLREDHFLANIGILMHYANRLSLTMVTNYGILTPVHQTTTFESYSGQQVSIFSFSPDTEITYHGLKYPVCKQQFKELWEGSLNEAVSESFTVEIEENGAVLVFRTL
ncbi:MAG: thiamine diphosphokinase [Bacteroidetes bacterium]|nr:thiamine diphosphokinase [Bacteroidota bacterium]MCL1968166.1 thiamine diphosphokinase [Bacteroidota bacterium]